ncbi:MAG: hypothetical protein O2818_03645 [Bacteroidetes bacterium]|nr:hypothetical protein [Bacteroidota bacterium]MDA1335961.1 hypothetical protein [Bacteroidota bacterium]
MWIAAFVLLAITALGALAYDRFGDVLKPHLSLILAFGGAFLIGIIFNHLVPETYALNPKAGWIVVLGFLIQGVLEYGSQGVEHGHLHVHQHHSNSKMPLAMFLSLCLHAFIESMPLHTDTHHHHHHAHAHDGHFHLHGIEGVDSTLLIGLILHKFPVALVLMGMLDAMGLGRKLRWVALILFGLMPLFGMLSYQGLINLGGAMAEQVPLWAGGILIGILLHISTTILFEAGDGHRFNRNKLLVTIAGLALALFST